MKTNKSINYQSFLFFYFIDEKFIKNQELSSKFLAKRDPKMKKSLKAKPSNSSRL
jgi:hypothetical protein